jgi:hypothetical protein
MFVFRVFKLSIPSLSSLSLSLSLFSLSLKRNLFLHNISIIIPIYSSRKTTKPKYHLRLLDPFHVCGNSQFIQKDTVRHEVALSLCIPFPSIYLLRVYSTGTHLSMYLDVVKSTMEAKEAQLFKRPILSFHISIAKHADRSIEPLVHKSRDPFNSDG